MELEGHVAVLDGADVVGSNKVFMRVPGGD
jgi:hypothetical protein